MLMKFFNEKKFQKLKIFVERLINFFQQVFKSNIIFNFSNFFKIVKKYKKKINIKHIF